MITLVGLCVRMEMLLSSVDYGDRTSQWFWLMMTNTKLCDQTDDVYDPEYVNERLDVFMHRDYDYTGEGGALFVVQNPPVDMREATIWYQMNYWVIEMHEGEKTMLETVENS